MEVVSIPTDRIGPRRTSPWRVGKSDAKELHRMRNPIVIDEDSRLLAGDNRVRRARIVGHADLVVCRVKAIPDPAPDDSSE